MKVAFVSDIHGNMPAWRAVQEDMGRMDVDRIICLGDMVGYGPHPEEALASVSVICDATLMGNHEAAAAGRLDLSIFNEHARDMINWTAGVLGQQTQIELARLPFTIEFDAGGYKALCVHSDANEPREFGYIIDENDARNCLHACAHRLVLLGHTHIPRADVLEPDGTMASLTPDAVELRDGRRYVLNIGSVGMSRDGDPRACYGILDTDAQTFRWRRVAFDLAALRSDIDFGPWPPERAARIRESFAHLWSGEAQTEKDLGRRLILREVADWHLRYADTKRDYGHPTHRRTIVWSLLSFLALSSVLGVAAFLHQRNQARPTSVTPIVVVATGPKTGPVEPLTQPKPVLPVPVVVKPVTPTRPPVVVVEPNPVIPTPTPPKPVPPPPAITSEPPPLPAAPGQKTWRARNLPANESCSFQWDMDGNWNPAGFPNAPGTEATIDLERIGIRTLDVKFGRDITIGKLWAVEISNATMIWTGGHLLTFDNGPAQAQWFRHKGSQKQGALRLTVYTDLRLNSTLELVWSVQRAIEIRNKISGPGGLVFKMTTSDGPPNNRRIEFSGGPNTYTGGTTLNGLHSAERRSIFVAEKNSAFGTGDVTVNEWAELVLNDHGAQDDMIADSAALRLGRKGKDCALLTLEAGVQETVAALYLDGKAQASGSWGSSTSGAQNKNDEYFKGPGILNVVANGNKR